MTATSDLSVDLNWLSILTLVVFVVANLVVIFPFRIPIYVPRNLTELVLDVFSYVRIIPVRSRQRKQAQMPKFVRMYFPMDLVTAPLLANLFLLAISAIGRKEIHDGTIGLSNISPGDFALFLLTVAYVSNSIEASGLIRYLSFKVLQRNARTAHRLYLLIYSASFALGGFVGNDPIIEFGMGIIAYITRMSANILHPMAWIYMQFSIVNVASAILVSSNPCNLMVASTFNIKFWVYSANMVVPVLTTFILLFPILIYVVFAEQALIPISIKLYDLPDARKARKPINTAIPHAKGHTEGENEEESMQLAVEDILNPFLDKGGATIGLVILAATVIVLFVLSATSASGNDPPVFWVTLPAAFVMIGWDSFFGWYHRHETRQIARQGRQQAQTARAERVVKEELEREAAAKHAKEAKRASLEPKPKEEERAEMVEATKQNRAGPDQVPNAITPRQSTWPQMKSPQAQPQRSNTDGSNSDNAHRRTAISGTGQRPVERPVSMVHMPFSGTQEALTLTSPDGLWTLKVEAGPDQEQNISPDGNREMNSTSGVMDEEKSDFADRLARNIALQERRGPTTLASLATEVYIWLQETFPTLVAAARHLPFKFVPFIFCIFILIQALDTNGWVAVFTHGWDHWVTKTGTMGAIGGMAFLSVVLSNFAGTNFGSTLLLSRIMKEWEEMHIRNGTPIGNRTFWGAVYAMAIGVNYGAFSTVFSASVSGLQWRESLARKHIRIRRMDFARVNLPIIAVAMVVGCSVLVGEVYITRHD